jgi:hypothetical protein
MFEDPEDDYLAPDDFEDEIDPEEIEYEDLDPDGDENVNDTEADNFLQVLEDAEEVNVLPDRVRSLENYIDFLSESISKHAISQVEFDNEILKTTYYLDMLTKKYNITTEAKQQIIEDARILRKEALEAYKTGAISEEKFNEVYTNAIRTEYSILKSSEVDDDALQSTRIKLMEDLTLEEKLEKLEKMEERQIKGIAKKHSIKFPSLPPGKSASDVKLYYNQKITNTLGGGTYIDVEIENYLMQYREAKKLVDYHTTSFEVSKIFYNASLRKPTFEFKLVPSIRSDIEKMRREDDTNKLLNPDEMVNIDRLNELKSRLRQMDKIDLIKCADVQLYELLTYIEKLRANKQYAFKFKVQPDALDIESQLTVDNEFYQIPEDKFLIGYSYVRPNVYSTEDTPNPVKFDEVGNLGYLALKKGKNPLDTISEQQDSDISDFDTIVPIQDELYSQLNTKFATYTEIVEVWEIHLDLLDSDKKLTLRYLSFEDFLLVFKRLLIKKTKDFKKFSDDELSDLFTKQSNIKYPRIKPRTAPFLIGQKIETKSPEELRYEYYNTLATRDEPSATRDEPIRKTGIDLSNPVQLKKSAETLEEDPDIKNLLNKIMQIEYYVIFKMDKQKSLPTAQISTKELLEDTSKIDEMREYGMEKLVSYISLTDPGATEVIKSIEAEIFNFSSVNYAFNIKKIIFIFDNFPEKMEDIVLSKKSESLGQYSIQELLLYETPYNLIEEKLIGVQTDVDKQQKIIELLSWKPVTAKYDMYKEELQATNHDFKTFIRTHTELKNLEINQIMEEYGEHLQWQKSISNYNKLEVPFGMLEWNFRLRFLLRQRNRLPSRRIFKLATISNRIDMQENLERTFGVCKVPNYKKLSLHSERIIYSLSKTPEDYMYYNYIINSKFKLICESLIALQESSLINEFEMVSIIIKFIINNGDFTKKDIESISDFTKKITPENIDLYISSLSRDELRAQNAYRLSSINLGEPTSATQELLSDASNVAESANLTEEQSELIYRSNNTYVPPVVYDVLPDDATFKKYFVINGQYICGGFFPPFYRWDENLVPAENYTRADLFQIVVTFSLRNKVSSAMTNYQIYEVIKNFIDLNESTPQVEKKLERTVFNPEITTPYQYLKIPIKTIIYTIRPRFLVQPPGEVYNVILDKSNVYGVPFEFDNGIPVYSLKLKELVENRFVIIEGPSIYKETVESNFLRSNYYILIEYTDPRGVKIFFKEGVSEKKIIRRKPNYTACERFDTQVACDDTNSFSVEIKGKRYKCIWKDKCVVFDDSKYFGEFVDWDMTKVEFSEPYKQKDWKDALEKSLKYIEDKIVSEKLSPANIELLKKDQKLKLFKYYKQLFKHFFTKEIGRTEIAPITEVVRDKSTIKEFEEILRPDTYALMPKVVQNVQEGYVPVTIYKQKRTSVATSVEDIEVDKTYSTYRDGTFQTIIPYQYNEDKNSYMCTLEDGRIIEVDKAEIYNVEGNQLKTTPIFCIIKKEDLPFLSKRPGYYWTHKEKLYDQRYDEDGNPEIVSTEVESIRYDVPTNFIDIDPANNLPGLPIITRENIFDAMYKTAFDTLANSQDSLIYSTVVSFDATLFAKKFAVMNRIDLKKIIKIGTIDISDLEKLPGVNYTVNTISPQQILDIITVAVEKNDVDILSQYYILGVKAEIDKNLLASAKQIIDNYKKLKQEYEEVLPPTPVEVVSKPVVSYVVQRGGKQRQIVEEN